MISARWFSTVRWLISRSAVSRRFVALSAGHMAGWMASGLSTLELLAIQIDGTTLWELADMVEVLEVWEASKDA
jgi:hypothetical protein